MFTYVLLLQLIMSHDNIHTQLWTVSLLRLLPMDLLGYQQPQHSQRQSPTAVMMAMHSLAMLQVLVRQMQPGADYKNAEVHSLLSTHYRVGA